MLPDTSVPVVTCAVAATHIIGESPVWSAREQALYWVDIGAPAIYRWHPGSGARRSWTMPEAVGSIGLRAAGGLVVALRSTFHLLDLDTSVLTLLAVAQGEPASNRLNDGKVGPDGSYWAGSMDERPEKQAVAALYRLDASHRCHRIVHGLKVSNGLAWSPDGRTMYHSDTREQVIWRHAHDPSTGAIGPREVFASLRPEWGRPDGGATDLEGCYWSCGLSAGRVNRFSPQGELVGAIELPVSHPTMPCFGGPDLRTMYVTSLRQGLSQAQLEATPLAGSIFRIEVGIQGTPVSMYGG